MFKKILFLSASLISAAILTGCNEGGNSGSVFPTTYDISGSISGLAASSLELGVIVNTSSNSSGSGNGVTPYTHGGGSTIPAGTKTYNVSGNSYDLKNIVPSQGSYTIFVATQPANETCSISHSKGSNIVQNITNANITCASSDKTFTVSGTLSGLNSGQTVKLAMNDGQNDSLLSLNADGSFIFAQKLPEGADYAITVEQQPNNETCSVLNGTGAFISTDINNIGVSCVNNNSPQLIKISGLYASGLTDNQQATIILNGDTKTAIKLTNKSTSFTFSNAILQGKKFAVTIDRNGTTASLNCSVDNGSGIAYKNMPPVLVACGTPVTISGIVKFIDGATPSQLGTNPKLYLNGLSTNDDVVTITPSTTSFAFPSNVVLGHDYFVQLDYNPTGNILCSLANNLGSTTGDISNVELICAPFNNALTFTIDQANITGYTPQTIAVVAADMNQFYFSNSNINFLISGSYLPGTPPPSLQLTYNSPNINPNYNYNVIVPGGSVNLFSISMLSFTNNSDYTFCKLNNAYTLYMNNINANVASGVTINCAQ